jgi:DnaJ family protein B protein 11
VTPNDKFERRGDHLHTTVQVSLKQALVGFKATIEHLDGHEVVLDRTGKVTRPFETVVVRGEGMPVHEVPSESGDLHVTVEVVFPQSLTSEQLKAINDIL